MPKKIAPSKRRALITMPPDRKVRIYSFHNVACQEAARARGYWTGDKDYIEDDFDRAHGISWLPKYDWMRGKMAESIPGYTGDYPMWGYLTRPNFRQAPYFSDDVVVLVADVPRGRMLISDYDMWHRPLNDDYCTWTEEEDERLEALGLSGRGAPVTPEMMESWDRIFDLRDRTDPAVVAWCQQPDYLQACIDRIYPHEVVSERRFVGRVGRYRRPDPCMVPKAGGKAAASGALLD